MRVHSFLIFQEHVTDTDDLVEVIANFVLHRCLPLLLLERIDLKSIAVHRWGDVSYLDHQAGLTVELVLLNVNLDGDWPTLSLADIRVEVKMVLSYFAGGKQLVECKKLTLIVMLETLGFQNELCCISNHSPDFLIHKENMIHRWIWGLFRNLSILVWLWWSSSHDDDTLVETVQDKLEVITLLLGQMTLRKDSFAVAQDTCDHLESDAAVHQVKENDHEPVWSHL